MIITTERTILRPWRDEDREPMAAMQADPEVMADFPAPLTRAESDAKVDRYARTFDELGYCRWALTRADGLFLGYLGIMPIFDHHPRAPGVEIGWRMARGAWGFGYATEAARAALADGFERIGMAEVLSYTAPENLRSQAVMGRLGLTRRPELDFTSDYGGHAWSGLVWSARRETLSDSRA
jgi:RimJ/RimL family protein N-acetyltransferase